MAVIKLSGLGQYGMLPAGIKPEEFARFTELAGFLPRQNGLVWADANETDVTASIPTTPDNQDFSPIGSGGGVGVLMRDDTQKTIELLPGGQSETLDNSGFDPDETPYDRWQFERFGNGVLINGFFNPPAFYDGGTTYAKLTAWDNTAFPNDEIASALRVYSERIFAIGTQDGSILGRKSQRIYYSSVVAPGEQPTSFDASDPSSGAGFFDLTDAVGPAIDAMVLGGSLIIYCEGSTHSVQYVGGSLLFSQRRIAQVGVPMLDCVVDAGGYHIIDTGADLMRVDGSGAQSILTPETRDMIYASPVADTDKHIVYRRGKNTLYVRADVDWYGGTGKPYYVVSLADGRVWVEVAASSTLMLRADAGSSDSLIRITADRSGTDTGVRLTDEAIGGYYRVQTERLNFGTMNHKAFDGVRLIGDASPAFDASGSGLTVTVTGFDAGGGQVSTASMDTPGDVQADGWMRCEVHGVYFDIKIEHSSGSTTRLEINEIEVDVTDLGGGA